MACVCHVATQGKSEPLLSISTQIRKDKLLEFAEKWAKLDKQPELDIAKQILEKREEINLDSPCHHACYLRFASSTHIGRAANSKRKRVST